MKKHVAINSLLLAIALFISGMAHAEEGGSGHYLPGSMASFVDGVSSEPAFLARVNLLNYDGDAGINQAIPIAGQTAFDVHAKSTALGLTLFWAPEWGQAGKWQYAMATTIPVLTMEVSADVTTQGVSARRSDRETGLGDILLQPVMFNYNHNPDLNSNYRVTIYAPTGSYETGRLANTGKNYWSIEPTAALMYLGQKNGIEASVFLGATFNGENNDTDYKTGTQVHVDGTVAQHFPLWSGLAGAGLSGYYYQQVTGDSGSGANLGDFKGKTAGVGPIISYTRKLNNSYFLASFKWLHEIDTKNRLKGDTLFLKAMLKY